MTTTVITNPVVAAISSWDENSVPEPAAAPAAVTETPAASVSAATGTLTWVQAAVRVLAASGEEMSTSAILEKIKEQGLRDTSACKTPLQTLRRDLRVEARKDNARVVATRKGHYRAS